MNTLAASMSRKLTVNTIQVVHETIDGETILIHLGSGTYYSLDGVGADVWAMLQADLAEEELLAGLCASYDVPADTARAAVTPLLDELLAEDLVGLAIGDHGPPREDGAADRQADDAARAAGAFAAPVLHKYTDMQEFMLVDPLHDVEADAGWPHVKAG
jgi:Coenzyme PQQ synthesis protein D (PqqD)